MSCKHEHLCLEASSHAIEAGYNRPTKDQRLKATITTTTKKVSLTEQATAFPAPLVLPNDDLALDPKYPAQSLRSWVREKDRNKVTPERRTIYLVDCPAADDSVGDMVAKWSQPTTPTKTKQPLTHCQWDAQAVVEYVSAFYHGLPVKFLTSDTFRFVSWHGDDDEVNANGTQQVKKSKSSKKRKREASRIGIVSGDTCIGIQTRKSLDGVFPRQLNLNDLLDAAIDFLPKDAYAFVMLVNHDLYEDEDDDFCCGRAYGGSRVAVISAARYNPVLDQQENDFADQDHIWPNSHCLRYMQAEASTPVAQRQKQPNMTVGMDDEESPLRAASKEVAQYRRQRAREEDSSKWLGRICRTVSHELGHCFGIDHCVYYACCMQSTASVSEDLRQPPYLCPVDLAKVLAATGAGQVQHYEAMLKFCQKHDHVELFAAFAAWIKARLLQLKQPILIG